MSWPASSSLKTYGFLAMIVGIFSFSIFDSLRDIRSNQSAAVEVTALNHWNASQARFELERTITALDAFANGLSDISKEDLLSRVDIFWSRLPTLYQGQQGKGLAELTKAGLISPRIMKSIDEMQPDIEALRPDDRQSYTKLRLAFLSFRQPLQDILLQVHQAHSTGYAFQHQLLHNLYTKHVLYLVEGLICVLILVFFLLRSTRKAEIAHRAAHDARVELEVVINALPLSVSAVDEEGRLVLLNDYGRKALGGEKTPWMGRRPRDVGMNPIHDDLNRQVLTNGQAMPAMEIDVNRAALPSQTWLVSKVPVKDLAAKVRQVITVGIDITDRKEAEARVRHMAHHDMLTGLPNRAFFQEQMVSALDGSADGRTQHALLYIDFDRFKEINDRLGHEAGDRFLIEASQRLARHLPPSATIARLGGDEFAVILKAISGPADASRLAEQLTEVFKEPIDVGGERWLSTISVGISLSGGVGSERLLRQADLALYETKALGGNTFRFFAPEMGRRQKPYYGIQQDLRCAIARDELALQYQPKVRLTDHQLSGFEALLRWNHPQHGVIAPSVFIPAAENSDLIVAIGQWVLRMTCLQIDAWRRDGTDLPPVAVNMSAAQFMRQDVAAMIEDVLNETGAPPYLLELEVTESILMENSESVLNTLRTLRAMNIGITLDDFGTGYSSLNYLQRFPIDKIKIDKTFVQPIARPRADLAIIRAIIAMAHSLDITVVAEGVETKRQRNILADMGCDEIQGFLISPAQRPEHLTYFPCFSDAKRDVVGSLNGRTDDVVSLRSSSRARVR